MYFSSGSTFGTVTLENSLIVSNKVTYISMYAYLWPNNSAPRYLFKGYGVYVHKMTCTKIFRLKNGNIQISINREINKLWHISTMEYYAAIKKNKVWLHEAT